MTVKTDLATAIVTALQQHEAAKTSPTEDNRTLADLVGGVRKGADNYPAKVNHTEAGIAMETARVAGLQVGRIERESRRKKAALARKHRADQIEALANSKTLPPKERIAQAWEVITPLLPVFDAIAGRKRRWVQRYLGDLTANVTTMAVEDMLMVLARSDKDLAVLRESAEAIISKEAKPALPEDATDEERKHRKAVGKGCSWVMGVVNNTIMRALDAAYRSEENVRWENLDILTTVLNAANGPQEDGFIARFKADRAPQMPGFRWNRPGAVDPALVSAALTAAITDRGLDPLVELFIAEGNTHPNGIFRWERLADQVFLLSPGEGPWMWSVVEKRTAHLEHPRKEQAHMAKVWVASLFEWMPGFIVDVVNALPDLPFGDGKRYPLCPALSYATPAEAAEAIAAVLEGLDEIDVPEPEPSNVVVWRTATPLVRHEKPKRLLRVPYTPRKRDYAAINAQARAYEEVMVPHMHHIASMPISEYGWGVPMDLSDVPVPWSADRETYRLMHVSSLASSVKANRRFVGGIHA
jgi:hypothetical protein